MTTQNQKKEKKKKNNAKSKVGIFFVFPPQLFSSSGEGVNLLVEKLVGHDRKWKVVGCLGARHVDVF
jgi:hypothetical protein